MREPEVFISSSQEGLDIAKKIRWLLLDELEEKWKVSLWTTKFEFSAAYIESLERASHDADFAVLVLTPDDVTASREEETPAPRDNVIFELGLFIGRIGRERCIIVHEKRPDLKVPTDLTGIHSATFDRHPGRDLESALHSPCAKIGERMTELGSRHEARAIGNAFWLGHDLARAIRFAMFEPQHEQLEFNLRQAIHHMDEIGLLAQDARKLLLNAIKEIRQKTDRSEDQHKDFITRIAKAKNEIGSALVELQPGFASYPSIPDINELNRQVDKL